MTVPEGETASFSVAAVGSALSYQWRKNGDPIDGATMASYSFTVLNLADQGAAFDVIVTDTSGSLTSSEAILTIEVDTLPPVISSALAGNETNIDIIFSESITVATAETVANYQISAGIQVVGAVLNANNKTVHLQTDTLAPDTVYTLAVSNIQDTSTAANEIAPGSTIEVVYTPSMGFDNGELPFGWTPLTASRWSVVIENGNNALFLNTTNYQALPVGRLGEHIISPDSYADFTFTVDVKTNEPAGNTNADYALVFGFLDGNNYYYMMFNRTPTNTQLHRVVEGERQLLATATDSWLTNDDYNTVTITRVGEAIEVSFGGNTVLQVNDDTFVAGKVGLGSFNDSAYFDNIRITGGSGTVTDLVFADQFE
ncbi:MAG: Ig-like domain-containing protein [Xanthomonadales bacterium]|nr:Ig-like domain-containing protein [Xanthomonadales bacterium]